MSHAFADIAFTLAVKAAQRREGSREAYERSLERGKEKTHNRLEEGEATFIGSQRSFYMATVSETGWPYVQHRGGPRGFLKVVDDQTLAFADFAGNRQMVSVGNLSHDQRIAIILVDYARRMRLKILGRLTVSEMVTGDSNFSTLVAPEYRARPQRAMRIEVHAFDWNCPQHIPMRIDAEDVHRALEERDARIAALEAQLAQRSGDSAP